jgi:hypothetical protein
MKKKLTQSSGNSRDRYILGAKTNPSQILPDMGGTTVILKSHSCCGISARTAIPLVSKTKNPEDRKIAQEEQIEQTVYAPDRQLRALIKLRTDGNYRVEVQKFVHDYSPDAGSHDRWERQSHIMVTDTLANAVEIAARSVGAGTDDFFGANRQ